MIRIGIAGLGFMGMVHYLTYQRLRGARVVAICDRNRERLQGDWRGIRGNFGPAGRRMDLAGVRCHAELDSMLADDEIDMIDVALPPAMHPEIAVKSLTAGRHVFCEKPMALKQRECRRMLTAANRAERRLLVGHVLPYFPEYGWALKTIRSGRFGALLGGSFKRVIAGPTWLKNFWSADEIGGPMFDVHVHDAHFIRLLYGMPTSVVTRGRSRDNLPSSWHSLFDFGANVTVEATAGVIDQQGRSFYHGFEIHLERTTLAFDFAVMNGTGRYLCPPTILDAKGRAVEAKLKGGDPMDAFDAELREVVACIKKDCTSDILSGELALDAIRLCHAQADSLKRGRPVRV